MQCCLSPIHLFLVWTWLMPIQNKKGRQHPISPPSRTRALNSKFTKTVEGGQLHITSIIIIIIIICMLGCPHLWVLFCGVDANTDMWKT